MGLGELTGRYFPFLVRAMMFTRSSSIKVTMIAWPLVPPF
jgi:hypothetical protein